ncbi:MAG: SH3 domain-containing protein [Synergistaceae bacterium]|nr:SH3 domain-containing protein [Synergistaceae bacterium]
MRYKIFIGWAALLCVISVASPASPAGRKFADLERFPQSASAYLPISPDAPISDYVNQVVYAEEYLRNHFAPWQNEDLSYLDLTFEKIFAFHNSIYKKQYYTADGAPFAKKSMEALKANAVVDPTSPPRPGVVLSNVDVRVLPMARSLYESKAAAAGSGGRLKLDVLQNSTLKPGEPVALYSSSGDSNWLFIASGVVVGWVRASAVSMVDQDFMDAYRYTTHAVITKDNMRVTDDLGKFLYNMKLGTVLPRDGDGILLPERGKDGMASMWRFIPQEGDAAEFPIPFTPRNAVFAIDQMMGEPYGWGGALGFRDCSAMTRDYFTLFGIWLPRNSGDQSITGARISLKNTASEERGGIMASRAIPFATLIHMPGHIMLYLGLYDGEPVVFHNTWGVGTNGGRAVIGRAVVTSLKLGAEIQDKPANSLLMDRIDTLSYPMADIGNISN